MSGSRFSLRRGVKVLPWRTGRSWGYVSWLPIVIDFGYLRFNRHWWHNAQATFWLVFWLRHGEKPTYYYWDRDLPVPCDGGFACHAETHTHGCYCDYGQCDQPEEHHAAR